MPYRDRTPSYPGHRSNGYHPQPAPEETLKTERLQVERKTFILSLKENPRGRFLRITEDVGGRRDHVIIPATGLEEFSKVIGQMVQMDRDTPAKMA